MSNSVQPHGLRPSRLLLSMGFPRQKYWSGLPFPSPGDLLDTGSKHKSPESPALAVRFFTTDHFISPLTSIQISQSTHTHCWLNISTLNPYFMQKKKKKNQWKLNYLLQLQNLSHLFEVFCFCTELFKESQFSSVTQSCPTLCNPKDCSVTGFPVHHQLPEFTQTHVHQVGDAIKPSHSLSSPSPSAFNCFQHQGLFQWVSSSHQVAKVLELQLQHQSFQWIFRIDFLLFM